MNRIFEQNQQPAYPDNADALRTRLQNEALNGAQGHPYMYFNNYFSNGGTRNHPLLGDLYVFSQGIKAVWNSERGVNLVAGIIDHKLAGLGDNEPPAESSSIEVDSDLDSQSDPALGSESEFDTSDPDSDEDTDSSCNSLRMF